MPIVQSSAFAFESAGAFADTMAGPDGRYVFTRRGNPTVRALEDTLADLAARFGVEVEYLRGDDVRDFEKLVRPATPSAASGYHRQLRRAGA